MGVPYNGTHNKDGGGRMSFWKWLRKTYGIKNIAIGPSKTNFILYFTGMIVFVFSLRFGFYWHRLWLLTPVSFIVGNWGYYREFKQ